MQAAWKTGGGDSQMPGLGGGAGKGGGGGGAIREAGGAFGKMEAAREEEYFRKLVSFTLHSTFLPSLACTSHR